MLVTFANAEEEEGHFSIEETKGEAMYHSKEENPEGRLKEGFEPITVS